MLINIKVWKNKYHWCYKDESKCSGAVAANPDFTLHLNVEPFVIRLRRRILKKSK